MPEITITIGGRNYEVACQEGEEHYLRAAAGVLDGEATALSTQIGRLPEVRMLLMAGLMLADKSGGYEDNSKALEAQVAELTRELNALKNAPPPEPEKIEVAVIPEIVTDTMAELAARAESLAAKVDEKAAAN